MEHLLKKATRHKKKYFLLFFFSLFLCDVIILRWYDAPFVGKCEPIENYGQSPQVVAEFADDYEQLANYDVTDDKDEKKILPSLIPLTEARIDHELSQLLCDRSQHHPYDLPTIQGCQGLESLRRGESWTENVKLQLLPGNLNMEEAKGRLVMKDGGLPADVTVYDIEKSSSADYVRGKEVLARLMKMQSWPGIPRVYAVCARSSKQKDICNHAPNTTNGIEFFSYIVERFDNFTFFCPTSSYDEHCRKLQNLQKLFNLQPNSRQAALVLIRNLASMFRVFHENGVLPLQLAPNQFVVTENFDVKLTVVEHLYFLPRKYGEKKPTFTRFFGDINCAASPLCHSADLMKKESTFKEFGQECRELTGLCDPYTSRCYGVDVQTYVCLFSKWIIENLITTVHDGTDAPLEALLVCTQQINPKTRCSWKAIENTLNRVLAKT